MRLQENYEIDHSLEWKGLNSKACHFKVKYNSLFSCPIELWNIRVQLHWILNHSLYQSCNVSAVTLLSPFANKWTDDWIQITSFYRYASSIVGTYTVPLCDISLHLLRGMPIFQCRPSSFSFLLQSRTKCLNKLVVHICYQLTQGLTPWLDRGSMTGNYQGIEWGVAPL